MVYLQYCISGEIFAEFFNYALCYVRSIHRVLFAFVEADERKLVETESIGNVFLIGINRPAKRNCVNQATAQQLQDAVKDFESDDELRVAVLYGKGLQYAVTQVVVGVKQLAASVILSICPQDKTKMAESTITKLGTGTIPRPPMNIRSKFKVIGSQSVKRRSSGQCESCTLLSAIL